MPKIQIQLVDRAIYPESEYPTGQWEYMLFYKENFAAATASFEASIANTVKALFRAGNPQAKGKPSPTARVRKDRGWFGGAGQAPDVPLDHTVLTPQDMSVYVSALTRTGFFGP